MCASRFVQNVLRSVLISKKKKKKKNNLKKPKMLFDNRIKNTLRPIHTMKYSTPVKITDIIMNDS